MADHGCKFVDTDMEIFAGQATTAHSPWASSFGETVQAQRALKSTATQALVQRYPHSCPTSHWIGFPSEYANRHRCLAVQL